MTDQGENDNEYLWDKSGAANAFVADLEKKLAPLSSARNPASPPVIAPAPRARALGLVLTLGAVSLAAAAAVLLVVSLRGPDDVVARGAATVDGVATDASGVKLAAGHTLTATGSVDVDLGAHGLVTLEPGSRLRLVENSVDAQTLALDLGQLHAIVDAPPELFSVQTPAVRAVDRGCEYTLSVDDAGATRVIVTSGAVMLKGAHDVVTFVPAGASALTRAHAQPGLPYRTNAGPDLKDAAERDDVARVLELASAADAISVWNVVARDPEDAAAFAKLKQLGPPGMAKVTNAHDVVGLYAVLDDIEARIPR